MDLDLKGKRVFVSGSTSGIGVGIALELAAEGASVVVHGRDRTRAEETARKIAHFGVDCLIVCGELTSDEQCDLMAAQALARFGGIDVLVNNVGRGVRTDNPPWSEITPEEWRRSFEVNIISAVRLCRKFTPGMVERGWGRVINISSIASTQRHGRMLEYGAGKAALDNFTVNLSKVLGPKGVTVNSVTPGAVLTPIMEAWLRKLRQENSWPDDQSDTERRYTQAFTNQSVPRIGQPRDVAFAVALLASPLSGYINGADLRIDGGAAS